MWRTRDWENPYFKSGNFGEGLVSWNEQPEFSVYEAGADAMLEALRKTGEYVDASKAQYGYVFNAVAKYPRTFKGWFILIPDEEGEN